MSQDIKFRGKRVGGDEEWIYGDFWDQPLLYGSHTHIYLADAKDEEEEDSGWTWVDRHTLGRYTTLNDSNQKEIYTGDLIVMKIEMTTNNYKIKMDTSGEIKQIDGSFYFISGTEKIILTKENTSDATIFGNIFDNKNLMND